MQQFPLTPSIAFPFAAIDAWKIYKYLDACTAWGTDLFMSALWADIKFVWVRYWQYVVLFVVILLVVIVTQIVMMRVGGHRNRLPPEVNRFVGSIVRNILVAVIVGVLYKIFGAGIIDDVWISIVGIIAYKLTGQLLRFIGFWYY